MYPILNKCLIAWKRHYYGVIYRDRQWFLKLYSDNLNEDNDIFMQSEY